MQSDKLSLDKIEAVIFDLDGSLIDSMWLWHAIDIEYLGRFGLTPPADLQARIGGRSFSETAVYFKETFQIPDTLEQIKADWNRMAWDKYSHEVPLKAGAELFIERCVRQNIRLGIATSNSRELVENVITVHRLNAYFDCIMTGCDVERGKPAPDIYLAAAKALLAKPERCLVFEDIIPGILAGKAAGMKVCAVYDDASAPEDSRKKELADYYIHDFRDIVE
ncbi:MAG: HAD family phosphatase [Muribaculaceae bacterium]|nr:HAD family phosphatase [Muribaculaceae bacterium]